VTAFRRERTELQWEMVWQSMGKEKMEDNEKESRIQERGGWVRLVMREDR
jgi:hypothetical protein